MEGQIYSLRLAKAMFLLVMALCFQGCHEQFSGSLFKGNYPHERYQEQLDQAGLEQSVMYRQWVDAARRGLDQPVSVTVPYQENAYMTAAFPSVAGYLFSAQEGERLQVLVSTQSVDSVAVFVDLFAFSDDTTKQHRHLISAEQGDSVLSWDVRNDGQYLLRIQPELMAEVSYDLRLTADPSLANPVDSEAKQHIGSVFGVPRDGGARRHEGIDIFAEKLTPVVAASSGLITRVGTNRLGGKVVWLRPNDRDHRINLYYAHLDSQMVEPGQVVSIGDTLGLMGNTGNAITTPPHLHFGVYGSDGAVDPMPFVQPGKSDPKAITGNMERLGDSVRIATNMPALVEALSNEGYRVRLVDGESRLVTSREVSQMNTIRTTRLEQETMVYAQPDTSAARITSLPSGESARVLGEYGSFILIDAPQRGWIAK